MKTIKELIKTTVRCFQRRYCDKHHFCPHIDNFVEDIYWRLQWKLLYIKSGHLTEYGMIDILKDCFKEKEAERWAIRNG